ncbi:hypothetical protein Y032_0925g3063 [Ancylostoma ceylanicum]|uniref:Reverse transcriptase domain-containing protein n=1 Tax=Ancylostoma ceylanicum TaxID=53326 RepID=A0A016W9A7_9BILA|nr:hypothetical protein Y032_0925g3063 [Ancylostoma ceylanicum]
MLAESQTPEVWQISTTAPVWEGKGDCADCSSYRPIRLLCHTMKIFERILDSRLRAIVSTTANQCGFVKDCGAIDAIHATHSLKDIGRKTALFISHSSISRKRSIASRVNSYGYLCESMESLRNTCVGLRCCTRSRQAL